MPSARLSRGGHSTAWGLERRRRGRVGAQSVHLGRDRRVHTNSEWAREHLRVDMVLEASALSEPVLSPPCKQEGSVCVGPRVLL